MKEIGGYFELEHYKGKMLHDDGIKLDCGRNCLAYLIKARKITRIKMPYYMCDCMFEVCREYGVSVSFYRVGTDFLPRDLKLEEDEYLYLMNYYGQLSPELIKKYAEQYRRVIVDHAQDYFREPVPGTDTLYTCRKFFGVPDGGILYTEARLEEEPEQSESFMYMTQILGRYERTASEFYKLSSDNNDRFTGQPVRKMSALTENLLRSIDYNYVEEQRNTNYRYLESALQQINLLSLKEVKAPFAYPLMIEDAPRIRKKLAERKIYIPVLWPNVVSDEDASTIEYRLANTILPIPCDQRYTVTEMEMIVREIWELISDAERE